MNLLASPLAFLLSLTPAQWFDQPLQPTDYASADGTYVLHVDPVERDGRGAMHCRSMHGAETVWKAKLEWTFEAAGVANDGTVIGYANFVAAKPGVLRVSVLDAKGEVRKHHDIPHETHLMHGPALPCATGRVLVHDEADAALIRVQPADQSRPSPWRKYRLSSGEYVGDVVPQCPGKRTDAQSVYERDARVVGDSGLTLCQWWTLDFRPVDLDWPMEGAAFVLTDLNGAAVWDLALPEDYTDRTSEAADDLLEQKLNGKSPILSVGPGNQFALRHVREGLRVEYVLERDEASKSGWRVRETARTPYKAEAEEPKPIETVTLVQRDTISLGSAAAAHAIRDVAAIGFTDAGQVEFLRMDAARALSYVRLRANGEIDFETDLTAALPKADAWPQYFDLSGDRWLLQFIGQEPPWLEVDVKTGATKAVPLPDSGLGSDIAPLGDGSYLALLPQVVRMVALTELRHVRADGTTAWTEHVSSWGEDDTAIHDVVGAAQGIVRTGERTFTVLSLNELAVIDLDRNVVRTTALADVLGAEPGYVFGLRHDGHGGVYFQQDDQVWRADADGKLVGSFTPARADGSIDDKLGHMLRVAPAGRVWTSDGARLYRLDDGGKADLVLGAPLNEDELREAERSSVDSLGRVLIQDRASQSLHVFDSSGKKLFVCKLAPDERSSGLLLDSFVALPDGTIWMVALNAVVQFDSKGQRVQKVINEPDTERALRMGNQELRARDSVKRSISAIERRPDGKWITDVADSAVLPDGRRLLLERPDQSNSADLHWYTPNNEPIASTAIPGTARFSKLSTSAKWIVISDYNGVCTLVSARDKTLRRFDPKLPDNGSWHVGQTPDGKTLLLLNPRLRELRRFELP